MAVAAAVVVVLAVKVAVHLLGAVRPAVAAGLAVAVVV